MQTFKKDRFQPCHFSKQPLAKCGEFTLSPLTDVSAEDTLRAVTNVWFGEAAMQRR